MEMKLKKLSSQFQNKAKIAFESINSEGLKSSDLKKKEKIVAKDKVKINDNSLVLKDEKK